MASSIVEPSRRTRVAGAFDVVVVGGGVAGVAAAVAAARSGASVCLIEKLNAPGGLATLGNVAIYLPLCDGAGRQVTGGLAEELLKLSVRDRPEAIPACWRRGGDPADRRRRRYQARFNPDSFLLEMERLLVRSGVALCYDTRFCDVSLKGRRVRAVIVENKSGRSAVACRTVVDASGDADVCARAGERTVSLRTNTAACWFYAFDGGDLDLQIVHRPFDPTGRKAPRGARGFAGDDGGDVTAMNVASRRLVRGRLAELDQARGGAACPVKLPATGLFRMTRRLKGRVEVRAADGGSCCDDAIGMVGDWRRPAGVHFVPLGALAGVRTENLLAAGRCISAAGEGWDIVRAIPACAVTGEAAGTAAALAAARAGGRVAAVDVGELQRALRRRRVRIDRTLASR